MGGSTMKSGQGFRVGTRGSRLAMVQTEEAAAEIRRVLPSATVSPVVFTTPGDRDKARDLRGSASDFFTRDLHDAVRDGVVDCAIHSAKDLEERPPRGLDWFWLSGGADPRDVVVLRRGDTEADLKAGGMAGVSSERRETYCRKRYPHLRIHGIRGTIEERLAQLDEGGYDLLVMAAAALLRLGMEERITRWIPLEELEPPEGQGHLALTFRAGDARFLRLRSCFVKPVVFAGAGSGSVESCTIGAADALARCDICLYDSLVAPELLGGLPRAARWVDVGKRCGRQPVPQEEINEWITNAARRGWRVVRLKGGDPGIFGRLAEEIEALDALSLPYRVVPGVSSLNAATTGTGILLTRRGVSRGFIVMTPRLEGGGVGPVGREGRRDLPLALFMAVGVLESVAQSLVADGLDEETPVAVVLDAGSAEETVIRGTLADIAGRVPAAERPGIVIVGSCAAGGYSSEWGALRGRCVLLPGTEMHGKKAADAVRDLGGFPLPLPLIRMVPEPECVPLLRKLREFDWVVVSSPSSARMLLHGLRNAGLDLRSLPKLLVAGPGTADVFRECGVFPDAIPDRDFGVEGILAAARRALPACATVLRLRSDRAGTRLSEELMRCGFRVTDGILYRNERLCPGRIPPFDAVFFASASAVEAFLDLQPAKALAGKIVAAMGAPTLAALDRNGIRVDSVAARATVDAAIEGLAAVWLRKEWEALS